MARLLIRPSKTFFNRALRSWLRDKHYAIALDAASAGFKNLPMLPADRYFGVDYNQSLLEDGLNLYPGGTGILADVKELGEVLPLGSVDLCVSTHTLSHLHEDDAHRFLDGLSSLNKQGGDLAFNVDSETYKQAKLEELVKSRYRNVTVLRYRQLLTRTFEKFASTPDGEFRPGPIGGFVTKSKVLAMFEMMSRSLNTGQMVLVFCEDATTNVSNEFSLSQLTQLASSLYASKSQSATKVSAT